METYVTLANGVPSNEDVDTAKALAKAGCKLISQYMLFGQYDTILIFEAPDAVSASMGVYFVKLDAGLLNSPSQTMRAFDEKDLARFREIAERNA